MILTSSSTSVSSFGRDRLAACDFLPGGRPGLAAGMTLCLPRMVFRGLTEMKHGLRVQQQGVGVGTHTGQMDTDMVWQGRARPPEQTGSDSLGLQKARSQHFYPVST